METNKPCQDELLDVRIPLEHIGGNWYGPTKPLTSLLPPPARLIFLHLRRLQWVSPRTYWASQSNEFGYPSISSSIELQLLTNSPDFSWVSVETRVHQQLLRRSQMLFSIGLTPSSSLLSRHTPLWLIRPLMMSFIRRTLSTIKHRENCKRLMRHISCLGLLKTWTLLLSLYPQTL